VTPKAITLEEVLGHFRPGAVIYIPGEGELASLRQFLLAEPERMRGVTLVSGLIPGVNDFDYAALHPEGRLRTFVMFGFLRESLMAGGWT
jgi:hypothetical protein